MVIIGQLIKLNVISAPLIVKNVRNPVPVQHAILTMDLAQDTVTPVVQVNIQMVRVSALHAG